MNLLIIFFYLVTNISIALADENIELESSKDNDEIDIKFYGTRTLNFKNDTATVEIVGNVGRAGYFEISADQPAKNIVGTVVTDVDISSISEKNKFTVDESGDFKIVLELPVGQVQLPLVFNAQNTTAKQPLVISFVVDEKKIQMNNKIAEIKDHKNLVWLGVGYNFLDFKQSFGAPISTELNFMSFNAPEVSTGYYRFFTRNFKLGLEYRSSPGATTSSSLITVIQGKYTWQAIVLDGVFFKEPQYPMNLFFGWRGRMQYRLGFQYHQVPFIRRSSVTSVNIHSDSIGLASLGLGFDGISINRKWKSDIFIRMQHLLAKGSEFNINSFLAFEGQLGLNRLLTEHWAIGLQWNGQYMAYNYDGFLDPPTNAMSLTGKLSMLHSLLEFRLAYSW